MPDDEGRPQAGELTAFEDDLGRLEACVRALESGDASLEESLKLYEDGMALAERCRGRIEAAEERVAQLVRGQSGLQEQPIPDVRDS